MSDVRVVEPHNTTVADAIGKVGAFEELLRKYGVKADWSGSNAQLKGTGVKGSIAVDATNVTVLVQLGMLARAAGIDGSKLEGSIRKRLRAAFGTDA
ncbi:MAG: polyhydroxyalkanoic acid system family protein [Myxococcales bacterium]|nr:polyhydroxyalkanoic acid system family protein [Myxococcales bacterium]MCB9534175.1 polyhydroxyalkanoic acid system family protein [Myxococcales bacterium]